VGIVTSAETPARARLDAWRERGADRLNPVRFHFIEAMERRALACSGEARRILNERLSKLVDAYAEDLERIAFTPDDASKPASPPPRGALAGLIDHFSLHGKVHNQSVTDIATSVPLSPSEPEMLDYFRKIWSEVSTERQLRQARDQVPRNAGPLNTNSLVHQSLGLMSELSPGYLRQFLSYVDALSWMEKMSGNGALGGKDTPHAESAGKNERGRSK
jgi:Protein of unknown function (DUF2894)